MTAGASSSSTEVWTQRDLLDDPRFADHPLLNEPYGVRSVAAVTVRGDGSHPLGTLFAFDDRPRDFTAKDLHALQRAASLIESNLQLRFAVRRVLFPEP